MARSPHKPSGDWIAVVESGYSLDHDDSVWLARLLDCIAREHWRDRSSAAFTFDLRPSGLAIKDVAVHGPSEIQAHLRGSLGVASREALDQAYGSRSAAVGTVSELIFHLGDNKARFNEVNAGFTTDILRVAAHSGTGSGIGLTLLLDEVRVSTQQERRRWTRCAAHIGAALRLRAMASELESLDGKPIEAIFDSGGRLHDARDAAMSKTAREVLRNAVRRTEAARSRQGRGNPDQALTAWEALICGRWSLVDRFDSDQRRFVVAIRNDPRFPDPRGLSLRERQAAAYAGLGRSAKEIAYLLGAPASSVENSLRRAQAKLGLRSRVELADFFAPRSLRASMAEIAVGNENLLVGSTPLLDERKLVGLSPAERHVLELLIAGSTDRDIARRRATSARTVANQVQALFRKFGVRSRGALVARLRN
ncbi:MAG TPA: helix-turn-helix transcriptional regulator [Steroidobacteraceae bacterium]|nr:helix-turn-helix transcriptional regulator [Steroidobacteraceae bacterium]